MFNADMIDNNDAHFMLTLSPACAHLTSKHRQRIDRDKRTYGKTDRWAHAGESVNIKCASLLSIMSALNIYFHNDKGGKAMQQYSYFLVQCLTS
jgi:hypothetical protein